MIIRKISLPRRTVLRGLGASVALPLLDAMVPAASALAQTAAKPKRRFGTVYVPNGMAMEYWTPATEGRGFELTPILQPLAAFQDQMTVVSGLRGYWTPAHAGASTTFLTGGRHLNGPNPGSRIWAGDRTGVAPTCNRRTGQRRTVQWRPQLRLYQHDLLAQSYHAAPNGAQPACRLRTDVRRQREHRP